MRGFALLAVGLRAYNTAAGVVISTQLMVLWSLVRSFGARKCALPVGNVNFGGRWSIVFKTAVTFIYVARSVFLLCHTRTRACCWVFQPNRFDTIRQLQPGSVRADSDHGRPGILNEKKIITLGRGTETGVLVKGMID